MKIKMVDRNGRRIKNGSSVRFLPTMPGGSAILNGRPVYGIAHALSDGGFYVNGPQNRILVWENNGRPAYDVEVMKASLADYVMGVIGKIAEMFI